MKEAKGDCNKLKERVEEEGLPVTLEELEQMVLSEKQPLTEDRNQLSSLMDRIGEPPLMQQVSLCYIFLSHQISS